MLDRYKRPQETVDALRDRLRELAMLGLQSDRYGADRDFRDAIDDALEAYRATVPAKEGLFGLRPEPKP